MKIEMHDVTIRELVDGYRDEGDDGVFGYGGRLDIRPPYQREFVYDERDRMAVIDSVMNGFPLNVMHWVARADGGYEVMDGQQRTVSIGQFFGGDFSYSMRYFHNFGPEERERFLGYRLKVYFCSGTDAEKIRWFERINIAGKDLSRQEIRNAVYHGPWVTDAKRWFSKARRGTSTCAASPTRSGSRCTSARAGSVPSADGSSRWRRCTPTT